MLIAAPPVEHTFVSMLSFRELSRISVPNLCWIEQVSHDSSIDTQQNSTIRPAVGSVTNFYPLRTKSLEVRKDSVYLIPVANFEQQRENCSIDTMAVIANAKAISHAYILLFSRNLFSLFTLIFEAPWFHFCILSLLLFRMFTIFSASKKKSVRLQLQMRLHLVIAMHRVRRLSYGGLLRVNNSPVPLHSLEFIFGVTGTEPISALLSRASLEDLQYFYTATDVVTFYVQEHVLKDRRTAKKEQRSGKALSIDGTDNQTLDVMNHLLFVILLLSL